MTTETRQKWFFQHPKKWFIHYFENGAHTFSDDAGHRIANEARKLTNTDGSPFFDHVSTFRKVNLGDDFLAQRVDHFNAPVGAGYWVWKMRIVQLTLQKMRYGDLLMYADTGCEIKGNLQPLFDLLQLQDIVPFHLEAEHSEERWTKEDLFSKLGVALDNVKIRTTPQRVGGYFLIRKTEETVKFIDHVVEIGVDLHAIDDSPSQKPNHPTFREHRHDQSIWSVLTKLGDFTAYPDPGFPAWKSTTIAASRRVNR